jgi:hypothetical protein
MNVQLKHSISGAIKEAKIGFSWTTLFFGFLVPLFRGDILWVILSLILSGGTIGLFWIIFPFIYNKIYIKKLLEKGYLPSNDSSKFTLVQKGWIVAEQSATNSEPQKSNIVQQCSSVSDTQDDLNSKESIQPEVKVGSNLKQFIENYMKKIDGYKKAWSNETLPADKKNKILKKFAPINLNSESILFAGIYGMGSMMSYGIIITEKNMYYRLAKGFFSLTKKGIIPLTTINTITAEHTYTHAASGGGNPGPEITVNGLVIGWAQFLMCMSEKDEELLIGLLNEINKSGILIELRK